MTTPIAQAAADAARATRERKIQKALNAYWSDVELSKCVMPTHAAILTGTQLAQSRMALIACLEHVDELTRLIAQRDGMPVSDGPDTGERRYG